MPDSSAIAPHAVSSDHARRRRTDQHFLQLEVVLRELLLHLLARLLLDRAAILNQLDQRARQQPDPGQGRVDL